MRLREIQKVLSENLSLLVVNVANQPNNQFQLTNILKAKRGIINIEEIGLFTPEIAALKRTNFFTYATEPITTTQQEYSVIVNTVSLIKNKTDQLLVSLKEALGDDSLHVNNISIKISKAPTLDGLLEIIEKLKKVISLPLADYEEGGEVKITNFDSGSFWIDVFLPTSGCVTLMGSIAWAGAVIYKKYQEAFSFKHYAETLEIQKELLKNLQEAAQKKIDLDVEAEAKLIQNEFYKTEDLEQLARLKLSIREYSELIQKGVEIQPSIVAPEKISNLFPNYKALELIDSKVKQISEGSK